MKTDVDLDPGTFLEFEDGSTQIPVGVVNSDLVGGELRVFTFSADMPTVTTTALYRLTLTANGTTDIATSSDDTFVGP